MKFDKRKTTSLILAAALAAAMMSGCGKDDSVEKATANNYEPYGKYESNIKLRTVKSLTTEKFAEGDDISNNVWTRSYANDLGIDVEYMWTVPEAQYDQKMNITIASGELPDVFSVSASQFKQLLDAGKIADLTEAYDKTASENMRTVISSNPNSEKFNKIDGKLMGFAGAPSPYDSADLIWIRTDWLKNLNLEVPKTMQELNDVIVAFANNDPDGNGQKDTYGLAISKELYGGLGGIQGYAAGYHAYVNMWYENGEGELVFGSIQPEMKAALQGLQDLMKQGAIDPEFGVKDTNKLQENLGASKLGVSIGAMWQPNTSMKSVLELVKGSDWYPYPLVSIDEKPACSMVDSAPNGYMVVRKEYKYSEAPIKMLNLYVDRYLYPENLEIYETYAHGGENGFEYFKYAPLQLSSATKNLDNSKLVREALETDDTSKLTPNLLANYEVLKTYSDENRKAWASMRIMGENGAFDIIDNEYLAKDRLRLNEFYDIPTKTMTEKLSTLEKMQDEVFTKIILGEDINTFDTFVEDWKRLGGDEITKEVNDWYKAK